MYRRLYAQPSRARGPHGALSTASWRRRQGGAQPEAGGGNNSETGSTRVVHWHLRANYANGRSSIGHWSYGSIGRGERMLVEWQRTPNKARSSSRLP